MSFKLEGIDFTPSDDLDFVSIEEDQPSKVRSLISAVPKGFIKELREQLEKAPFLGKQLKKMQEENPSLVRSNEDVALLIEKYLPTRDSFAEKALERGGRIAPYAFLGGGNLAGQAVRSALAGFLGEGAKESGLPPWAQALAELPAFGFPSLAKKINPSKSQKALVEGSRKLGLSEEEITPLIQSERKQKFLGKAAPRRGRTQNILKRTQKALGNVYEGLEKSPAAVNALPTDASEKIIGSITDQLENFPSGVRKVIQEDFHDLLKKPITGQSLINFYRDINHYLGKGEQQLGILKEPIFKALESISPELASDFRLTNKLFTKYYPISNKLKPSLVSDLFGAGEAIRLLTGLSLGNFPILTEIIGEHSARILARELLLNPRLQNISKKIVSALNENKIPFANQLAKQYAKEFEELDPEISEKLKGIDFKDLKEKGKQKRP